MEDFCQQNKQLERFSLVLIPAEYGTLPTLQNSLDFLSKL